MNLQSHKVLAEQFADTVFAYTGIPLQLEDISLHLDGEELKVVVWGYEIARLKISENMDEDELKVALDGITSEIPDLRQRLIENFIRMLVARVLPKASERIITALRRKDIPEDVLDSLMFSIEDLGYERRHWETEEEAEWGFPILALEITMPEGMELLLPMDLSNIDNPVDVEEAVQRLEVALAEL